MQYANSHAGVQSFLFDGLFKRQLTYEYKDVDQTGDAGLGLFAALDRRHGLTKRFADALSDYRVGGRVSHPVLDLVRQRALSLLAGYEDANDAGRLRHDLTLQSLLDRMPDEPLASQSTLSRFENAHTTGALMRAGHALADTILDVLAAHYEDAKLITIDLDPTDDPAYGQQHFSFYHGYYGGHGFLPQLAFVTMHGRRRRELQESYLVAALLRHGRASATEGALGLLRRLVKKIRRRFVHADIRVRLDGGFATPQMLAGLEALNVEYLVNIAKNSALEAEAAKFMEEARAETEQTGQRARRFGSTMYCAKSWPHARRVVIKAEVTVDPKSPEKGPRDNPRFVVTNIYRRSPEFLYATVYCGRARPENRIKEFKHDGALGRNSCTRFLANQLRLLIAHLAYSLIQLMRLAFSDTPLAIWQYGRMRLELIKQPAIVRVTTRRLVFQLPRAGPNAELLSDIGRHLTEYLN
jgi:hypothetical protein